MPIESIDPVYFDKTYYLAPDKGAAKPYALLTEALKESKRCAVGRWAARGKANIVIAAPDRRRAHDAAAAFLDRGAACDRGRGAEARGEAAELKLASN